MATSREVRDGFALLKLPFFVVEVVGVEVGVEWWADDEPDEIEDAIEVEEAELELDDIGG